MKILLINSNRLKEPYPVIPIGLCSIASVVENAGHEVKILDLCFINDTEKEIRENIDTFKPSLIGISIRNIDTSSGFKSYFLMPEIKENVTDLCKKYFTGPIVIGGSAVGINPVEILEYLDLVEEELTAPTPRPPSTPRSRARATGWTAASPYSLAWAAAPRPWPSWSALTV